MQSARNIEKKTGIYMYKKKEKKRGGRLLMGNEGDITHRTDLLLNFLLTPENTSAGQPMCDALS